MKRLIIIILIITLPAALKAQEIFTKPLSNRVVWYNMDVSLNTETKIIDGVLELTWRNISKDTIEELQFHTYLNAFKNTKSTFMKESGGSHRGMKLGNNEDDWGWIDINKMQLKEGADLSKNMQYIHPDDNNKDDQTVLQVLLNEPVMPGDTIVLDINFTSKLPAIFARTGFSDNYFFAGQWFPKIGVYEPKGWRKAEEGGWNCHQFHLHSEFYANFGVYQVDITLPQGYTLGATGLLMDSKINPDGTETLRWRAEDVIDFSWTASQRFIDIKDTWEDVDIRLLIQPEHKGMRERYISSVKAALAYMDQNVGEYPYSNITVIDPPVIGGMGSGGMEYPTLITGGGIWGLPKGLRQVEMVSIHEFIHQYFMGMVASNEFEEPWLDEGFTTYYQTRVMDHTYGDKSSLLDFAGLRIADSESTRGGYVNMVNPKIAPNTRAAWEFEHGGYSSITYNKAATWLMTLEGIIGKETMDKIMQTYFERWKFRHPTGKDFIAVVNEVVNKDHGNKFGKNMNWFFDQVLDGTEICDYKLAKISNDKVTTALGVFEKQDSKKTISVSENTGKYNSTVVIHRLGEVKLPVEVLIHFENGEEVLEKWDGQDRSYEFSYTGKSKIAWAEIDPEHKLAMDINTINNSYKIEPEKKAFWKYFEKFLFFAQNVMHFFSIFV